MEVVAITTTKVAEDVVEDVDVVIKIIIALLLRGNIVGLTVHVHTLAQSVTQKPLVTRKKQPSTKCWEAAPKADTGLTPDRLGRQILGIII